MILALTASATLLSVECFIEGAMCAVALWTGKRIKKGVLNH